ncbi:unnamed protein product [Kuraishia capsulata CBS 1993]|uniref:RING-type domain-containing protein n=1 Tax=Kuraishia capsulata CBS 1993 TaxID=1382522 RepID=W6MGE9_9ASCO|nr:uncharacterized protein KUCA_T00000534001 [Kuraishia capsulata CBS 1993]CDK24568.1 unnamed protein product [Kuraishia capsulata CBS 1993]
MTEPSTHRNRLPIVLLEFSDGRSENITIEFGERGEPDDLLISTTDRPVSESLLAPELGENSETTEPSAETRPNHDATADTPQNTSQNEQTNNETASTAADSLNPAEGVSIGASTARMLERLMRSDIGNTSESPNSPSPGTDSNATSASRTDNASRNIILTVNYVYSAAAAATATATSMPSTEPGTNRSGSLVLHVPNIPTDHDEESIQVLIRLATSIAFRTIASALKRHAGVSTETFESFPVKKLTSLTETTCPICYDEFVEADVTSNKRKRAHEDDEDEDEGESHPRKSRTRANGSVRSNPTAFHPASSPTAKPVDLYTHSAVEMPCHHVFGRSCLFEWLRTNDTCPLCRDRVATHSGDSQSALTANVTTLSLPNLASVVRENQNLISSFSNRPMNFLVPRPEEGTIPGPTATRNAEALPAVGGGGLLTGAFAGLGLMRRFVESIRAANAGNAEGTRDGMRNMMAIFATSSTADSANATNETGQTARPETQSENQPETQPETQSETNTNAESARRQSRREVLSRLLAERTNAAESPQELFSVGVASRRTDDGVVTVPVNPRTNNHDILDDSMISEWLYDTPHARSGRRRRDRRS